MFKRSFTAVFLLMLIYPGSLIYGQMVYFSEPTSSTVLTLNQAGNALIQYDMYVSSSLYVTYDTDYKAMLKYPDGHWSAWQAGSEGSWLVTDPGTYMIKGKVWAKNFILGTAFRWYYRDPFSFSVTEPPALSVTISGPTSRNFNQDGTWTASVSGGYASYHYQWYYKYPLGTYLPPSGYWNDVGTDSPTLTRHDQQSFQLKCVVTDAASSSDVSNILFVSIGGAAKKSTQNQIISSIPKGFNLLQNYPNPFNPSTVIKYDLAKPSQVNVAIYDILGRKVKDLFNGFEEAGTYKINFNASDLSSGIYLYRITAKAGDKLLFSKSKEMTLMK